MTIDDLITMVSALLDGDDTNSCAAGDVDLSGHLSVDELVLARNAALGSCR